MDVQTYNVSKLALMAMPEQERDFFLLVGHFANEIIFLSKLLIMTRIQATDRILEKAELTQGLVVQKILAGKLYEGWKMIRARYYKTAISKDYDPLLDEEARIAIKAAKTYFNKQNLIAKVRNSYSFHYDPKELGPTIQEIDDGDELDMYVAAQHINSLYYVSESVLNKAMLNELGPDDIQTAFDELFKDLHYVHKLLLTFINNFMKVAVGRYFVRTDTNPAWVTIKVDVPNLDDVAVPFFVNAP